MGVRNLVTTGTAPVGWRYEFSHSPFVDVSPDVLDRCKESRCARVCSGDLRRHNLAANSFGALAAFAEPQRTRLRTTLIVRL